MPINAAPAGAFAPPVGPPVAPVSWRGLTLTWTGPDGVPWELTDPATGVFLTPDGVRGLTMPKTDRFSSVSPVVPGSRWRGHRVAERDVFWPLAVYSDQGSDAWLALEEAWWSTLRPDTVGAWTCSDGVHPPRTLWCRFVDDGDAALPRDPSLAGWQVYGINLVAEQPYWEGQPVVRSWVVPGASGFFDGPGIVNISPGATIDTATMPNPGDVPARVIWTVTGPFTSVVVGVQGKTIAVPFAMTAGQSLTIDTREDRLTAVDGAGVDRTAQLGAAAFVSVPPGDAVPLSLSMLGSTSASSVGAALTPLYYRAWS